MDFNSLYTYEDGRLISKKSNMVMSNYSDEGYLRVRINGKEYRGHRIIWEMHNGEIPTGYLIDHINGDRSDNRIENLRLSTRQQNNVNSKPQNGIKYKGVTRTGSRFRARISYNGSTYSLGTFASAEEAAEAYNNKAMELHGEFAYCNRE